MFTRIRMALVLLIALLLLAALPAFAKGGFDYIMVTGPDLEEGVRIDDPRLTEDFFTFADFSEDRTTAPADPGKGYEITRHYLQGTSSVIFDRLHYYPDTGLVYYDGIENGDSEYDDEWYWANANIKPIFESVLAAPAAGIQAGSSAATPSLLQSPLLPYIALMAALTIASLLAVRSRRSALR